MDAYEESGEALEGVMGFALSEASYKTRNEQQRFNSEHDLLTDEERLKITEFVPKVFQRGRHDVFFSLRY